MAGFLHWLWGDWLAVYPNLEASALAFGAGILVHHWALNKKFRRVFDHMETLHHKVEALHVEVASGQPSAGRHAEPTPRQ